MCTTEKGEIAVASDNGDVRLFKDNGSNARN